MTLADLDTRWTVRFQRLHLGVELVDALGGTGPTVDVGLHHENVAVPAPLPGALVASTGGPTARPPFGRVDQAAGLPGIGRSPSGRFAASFGQRGLEALDPADRITLRITSPRNRYVPRRLSVPVPLLVDVEADERVKRTCRPHLYPGAASGRRAGETVILGRALWDNGGDPPVDPVRWARVTARTHDAVPDVDPAAPPDHPVLGRAHGDETGEFVLVLGPLPVELAAPVSSTVTVDITVAGRAALPVPLPSPTRSTADPLWDLPIEVLTDLDPDGGVVLGETDPPDYTATAGQVLTCPRGTIHRPAQPFVVVP